MSNSYSHVVNIFIMENEGEILRDAIKRNGLTQAEAAELLGMTRQNLHLYLAKKKIPNKTWVIIKEKLGIDRPDNIPGQTIFAKQIPVESTIDYKAPLVPIKAQAGYSHAYTQAMFIDNLEKFALPPGITHHGAVWRYWEIAGDSMEPTFHSRDVILTSQVNRLDWENIRDFYVYVIVTDEKVMVKRVFKKSTSPWQWVLISDNEEEHEQQLLNVEEVREVWVFRRHIVNKAPAPKMFEIKI